MKELINVYNAAATVAANIEKQALTFDLKGSLAEMKASHMAMAQMVHDQKTQIALHGQELENHTVRIEHLEVR